METFGAFGASFFFFDNIFRCRGMTKSCIARSYLHVFFLFLPFDLNCGRMVHCWKTIDLELLTSY